MTLAAPTPDPDPAYLTIPETAALLRVSRQTVARRVRSGALPAVRIGRVTRIPLAALAAWAAGGGEQR